MEIYGLYGYFSDFITSQQGFERKPSPDAINYLINKYDMIHSETIMIGDRDLDLLAAKNAGISACYFTDENEKMIILITKSITSNNYVLSFEHR